MMREEPAWAVIGRWNDRRGEPFLYYGTYPTRKDAIESHTRQLGKAWVECRNRADRTRKVWVNWEK